VGSASAATPKSGASKYRDLMMAMGLPSVSLPVEGQDPRRISAGQIELKTGQIELRNGRNRATRRVGRTVSVSVLGRSGRRRAELEKG
jgi:hypothetical protein